MAAALTFENVVKCYRGPREYKALRDDLAGSVARLVSTRRRPRRGLVRALDGIDLEVPAGQSFGLIGANGAGKTTALKLATRIAYPTSGTIRVRGRVGALIEIGTGMHPELTGRENVALYGRILGLSKRDVNRRFDEIIAFADIGAAVDQPVKQYSSGMQLRLGFSIAAHLEPDVLLVDEAIAVGDAGFQYRCVERMSKLVAEGRTLVFVSHDMSAIAALCTRAVVLHQGRVRLDGPAPNVVAEYLRGFEMERLAEAPANPVGADLEIMRTTIHDETDAEVDTILSSRPMTVRFHYRAHRPVRRPIITVGLGDGRVGCFALASMLLDGGAPEVLEGSGTIDCTFEETPLVARVYDVWCGIRGERGHGNLVEWQRMRRFRVIDEVDRQGIGALAIGPTIPPVVLPYRWSYENGDEP